MKAIPGIIYFLFSSFFFLTAIKVYSQKPGLGGVLDSRDKVIWLKAENIELNNNQRVEFWPDASGNENHAYKTTDDRRPNFFTSGLHFNNLPFVRFNENPNNQERLVIPDHPSLDDTDGLTIITVIRPLTTSPVVHNIIAKSTDGPNATFSWYKAFRDSYTAWLLINTATHYNQRFFYEPEFRTDRGHLLTTSFNGSDQTNSGFANAMPIGTYESRAASVNRNSNANVVIGNGNPNDNFRRLMGDIAEIIVYRKHLTRPQRLIIENILAHRYNISISPFYFLEDFPQSYGYDMVGVGMTTVWGRYKHSSTTGAGGALYLAENNNSFSFNNEFVFAGHNNLPHNENNTNDLPPEVVNRWNRIWRLQKANEPSTSTSVRVTFDFVEAELPVDPTKLYVLLYRSGTSGQFQIVDGLFATASEQKVTFAIPGDQLVSGYYTLGITDAEVRTWRSVQSGAWNNPSTWEGGLGYPVNPYDNVQINNTHNVTIQQNGIVASDLWIREGGSLVIDHTRDHQFNTLRGQGRIIIDGNYFPAGDATQFNGTDGGTVVYTGTGNYLFNVNRDFNNLEISLDDQYSGITLAADLNVLNNFFIRNGKLIVNDESDVARTINVGGNFRIGDQMNNNAFLAVGSGNALNGHRIVVKGNFINYGTARLSNLTQAEYYSTPEDGYVSVVFDNKDADQSILLYGLTEFYRIEVDKGLNTNISLRIWAFDRNLFFLWGRNNFTQANWSPNISNPNALGLLSGTVIIDQNIEIPRLKSNEIELPDVQGNYIIDSDVHLILDGGRIGELTPQYYWTIMVYGKLTVKQGEFYASGTQGITLSQSGTFTVDNGTVFLERLKTDFIPGELNRGTYIQNGGTVMVRSLHEGINTVSNFWRFSLGHPENGFFMTAGTLTIYPQGKWGGATNGGLFIGTSESNTNVSGGTIICYTDEDDFWINSTAPFYNLIFRKATANNRQHVLNVFPGNHQHPFLEAQPLIVKNQFILENNPHNVLFDLQQNRLIIEQNFFLESGAEIDASHGTIEFHGNSNSLFRIDNPSYVPIIANLIVNKTAMERVVKFNRLTPSTNQFLTVEQLLNNQRGTVDFSNHFVLVSGDVQNHSVLGIAGTSGYLLMNSSLEQNIIIPINNDDVKFSTLEIRNQNGVVLRNNSIPEIEKLRLNDGVFNIKNHGILVTNSISGANFGYDNMIATSGSHSDGGVRLRIPSAGSYLIPVGTTANNSIRYTPLRAEFSSVLNSFYLQVNPVDRELSTLANADPDLALTYYWRIRHDATEPLPYVSNYIFSFHPDDLPPAIPVDFVPGKVVNDSRLADSPLNIDLVEHTVEFNDFGNGFELEIGEYTAGNINKFIGTINRFYSLASNDPLSPAMWHEPSTWSKAGHNTPDGNTEIPGLGDMVQIGFDNAGAHSVLISDSTMVSGVHFLNNGNQLPSLILADSDIEADIGVLSGYGSLIFKLGNEVAGLNADVGDFSRREGSMVGYYAQQTGTYSIPVSFPEYPGLKLKGPGNGDLANIYFPEANVTVFGSVLLSNGAVGRLSSSVNGDVTIKENLSVGHAGDTSKFIFPNGEHNRQVLIEGNLIVSGNTDAGVFVESGTQNTIHQLEIQGNIHQNGGQILLYRNLNQPRVGLVFSGDTNSVYQRTGGLAPQLYRLRLNKTQNNNSFTFNDEFILNGDVTGVSKSIELIRGQLILNSPEINVLLNHGNTYPFLIPSSSALILQNANARVTGNGNIRLDGLLRLEGQSGLIMNQNGSASNIEYGSTGSARLEITGLSTLSVGSRIRGIVGNDTGVLKYLQTGGVVTIGANAPVLAGKGIFEIYNNGSSFTLEEGEIVIETGFNGARADLYLLPEIFQVDNNAIVRFGSTSSPSAEQISIQSLAPLPNVYISSSNTLQVFPLGIDLTIGGDLLIEQNNTFFSNNLDLFLKGNVTVVGNLNTTSGGRVVFNGNNQVLNGEVVFNHLVVNVDQSLTMLGDIEVSEMLDIQSGTLFDNNYFIHLKGNMLNNALHVTNENSGGLIFSGTIPQMLSGNGQVGKVIVDNTHGVYLDSNHNVNDSIIFNDGLIDIDSHLLTLGQSTRLVYKGTPFSAAKMIRTSGDINDDGVRLNFTGTNDMVIPLGTPGRYTPVVKTIFTNLAESPYIQVVPVNQKHSNLIGQTGSNLNYYWRIVSGGLSDFTGELKFYYHNDNVEGDDSWYYPARLYDDAWQRLSTDDIDHTTNEVRFQFLSPVEEIGGDYTAGADIPEIVLRFRSIANGSWDGNVWENITPGYSPDNVPSGGPLGQIVEILPGHTVSTGEIRRISFRTKIDGSLVTNLPSGLNHYLGEVSGQGMIVNEGSNLPVANYSLFSSHGTFNYTGTGSYIIDRSRFPLSGIQNLILSGTGQRIMPAGTLIINGNLSIIDDAELNTGNNNSRIELKGDLFKDTNAIFSSGFEENDRIVFNGSSLQSIYGNFTGLQRFNIIELNNPIGLELAGEAEIYGRLSLQNGRVITSSDYPLRILETATITGASPIRYIDGPLQKKGNSTFVFPVGNNGRLSRIAFQPSNIDGSTIIQASYHNATTPNYDQTLEPLAKVSSLEFWSLDVVSGNKSGPINGNVMLYVEDEQFSGINFPEDLLVGWYNQFSDTAWWESLEGGYFFNSVGYIQSQVFDLSEKNGLFTFGSHESTFNINPLPIELAFFKGEVVDDKIILEWATYSETNNDFFTIERSTDGVDYYPIGFVAGAGNSNHMLYYDIIDHNPLTGLSYYRLKQTDFDGKYEYSAIVAVNYAPESDRYFVNIFPNPVVGNLINVHLYRFGRNQQINLRLFDMYGKSLYAESIETDENGSYFGNMTIDSEFLKSGIYILTITGSGTMISRRLVKP